MGYVFAADSIVLRSFVSMQWASKAHACCYVSCNIARNDRSRLSKVIDFGTN